MGEERQFKGIWIPKEIWLDDNLSALDKVILAEIDSLDDEETGCYASNEHIAAFCKCSKGNVSRAISKLIQSGYIYIKSFDGRKRVLKSKIGLCKADFTICEGRLHKSARQTTQKSKADFTICEESNIDSKIGSNIDENIYTQVKQKFCEICISLPKIISIDKARKATVKARLKEYSLEQVEEMFRKAEKSDFLTGRIKSKGERPFKASFDWLMKPSNFIKVLEGNYDNREVSGNGKIGEGSELYRFKTTL
jgi:hypothetical protein